MEARTIEALLAVLVEVARPEPPGPAALAIGLQAHLAYLRDLSPGERLLASELLLGLRDDTSQAVA